jgi:hypothetical protein
MPRGIARGGTVLLSRDSSISATGTAGDTGEYALTDGSQDFNGFADVVDTSSAGFDCPRVSANQHSQPALSGDAAFTGAYAEGSVSTEAAAKGSDMAPAEALSNFDLKFQIVGEPSQAIFGGAVGVSGNGSAAVTLSNESTGEVVLEKLLLAGDGDGEQIEHSAVLEPGVYSLSIEAHANGQPDESMAYFSVNLSLAPVDDGGEGAHAIPVPPATWSAGLLLVTGGVMQGLGSWKKRRNIRA